MKGWWILESYIVCRSNDTNIHIAVAIKVRYECLPVEICYCRIALSLTQQSPAVACGIACVGDIDLVDAVASAKFEGSVEVDIGEGIQIVWQGITVNIVMVWRGKAFAIRAHRAVQKQSTVIGIEDIFATDQFGVAVAHDVSNGEEEVVADNCGGVEPSLDACRPTVIVAMHIAFPVEKE